MSIYIPNRFKCKVLHCVKQFNAEYTAFECDFLCYIMIKRRNTVLFDAHKVLIITPIESNNNLVKATFYGSYLKQFNAECTVLDCDFHCHVMVMRGEILYHIWCP